MVLGVNKFWKQISILKSTTTRISYRCRFTGFARCRLIWVNGMAFVLSSRGNPYTSKASFLDDDFMPIYSDKNKPKFSGRRIGRGLYRIKNKAIVNADLNASANIGRKIFRICLIRMQKFVLIP